MADAVASGVAVTDVVIDELATVQRTVGEGWQAGRYSIAQEHKISAVVDDALGLLAGCVATPTRAHRIVLACADDEWHVGPARMAALCLRDAGWQVDFLGGSVPADHLAEALSYEPPFVLAISATLPLSLRGVARLVAEAHARGVPVIVDGAAFSHDAKRADGLSADAHTTDLRTVPATLEGWLDAPPELRSFDAQHQGAREAQALSQDRGAIVDGACLVLANRLPAMATYDERQRNHTRRDLDFTLQFLETALLVGDDTVFTDYTSWLVALLMTRNLTAQIVTLSLQVLRGQLPDDLVRARALLAGVDSTSHELAR